MGAPGPGSAGPLLLACSGGADAALDRALAEHGWATLLGRCERPDKYAGIGCAEADALRSRADLVLVEADGARGRSLKAPAAHEPVVPPASDVVVVVAGLDALGAALDAGLVHRLERVCALTGRPPGAPVDEDVLVGTLSLGGYPERSPAAARTVVFLNKAEDESREAAARRVARRLVPPYAAVLAGSARAGRGRRLA
jgi:probable selenium-dependent hydroxylase accessory protein YqeC